ISDGECRSVSRGPRNEVAASGVSTPRAASTRATSPSAHTTAPVFTSVNRARTSQREVSPRTPASIPNLIGRRGQLSAALRGGADLPPIGRGLPVHVLPDGDANLLHTPGVGLVGRRVEEVKAIALDLSPAI